jgi:L-2-hydroxyglutarate oxidase LhgO
MIRGDTLVRSARKRRQETTVTLLDKIRDVAARFIPRVRHGHGALHHMRGQNGRLPRKALVDKHLRVRRVVNDQQRHMVDKVRLPELRRNPNIVPAVAGS